MHRADLWCEVQGLGVQKTQCKQCAVKVQCGALVCNAVHSAGTLVAGRQCLGKKWLVVRPRSQLSTLHSQMMMLIIIIVIIVIIIIIIVRTVQVSAFRNCLSDNICRLFSLSSNWLLFTVGRLMFSKVFQVYLLFSHHLFSFFSCFKFTPLTSPFHGVFTSFHSLSLVFPQLTVPLFMHLCSLMPHRFQNLDFDNRYLNHTWYL